MHAKICAKIIVISMSFVFRLLNCFFSCFKYEIEALQTVMQMQLQTGMTTSKKTIVRRNRVVIIEMLATLSKLYLINTGILIQGLE